MSFGTPARSNATENSPRGMTVQTATSTPPRAFNAGATERMCRLMPSCRDAFVVSIKILMFFNEIVYRYNMYKIQYL